MQGRWWPTWKRAARDAPGQMTPLAGSRRCHRHVPSLDHLQGLCLNPIRARREGCRGDTEWGLDDRTTPAADYRGQRSDERHMPLKLLRRARWCFHLQAPPPNTTRQPFDAHFVLVNAENDQRRGFCSCFTLSRYLHPSGFPVTCTRRAGPLQTVTTIAPHSITACHTIPLTLTLISELQGDNMSLQTSFFLAPSDNFFIPINLNQFIFIILRN